MAQQETFIREDSANVPRGWKKIKKLSPGLIWMVSSIGSGTILFTPRIGARYEYELLWMAIAVTILIYIIIKEVGRYTVVTGKSIIRGFSELPGRPGKWGLWILFAPQLIAGFITVSGLAALAGSALLTSFGGDVILYALAIIILCLFLIVSGKFPVFEKVATIMAGLLVLISFITAARVVSQWDAIAGGMVPAIPGDFEIGFVLPWLGFYLAGAAGLIWYSYWVAAREYGGPLLTDDEIDRLKENPAEEDKAKIRSLKKWIKVLNTTSLTGIITGGLINIAFLVLGAELLAPREIIPEGVEVADDLALLLSEVWGEIGRWFLLVSILIALLGSVLSNQDGYGRMFSDATLIVGRKRVEALAGKLEKKYKYAGRIREKQYISNFYRIVFTAALPAMVYVWFNDPVEIMSVAGIISAIHIPFIIFGTIYLNKKTIPVNLQPGIFSYILFWIAGLFYFLLGLHQVLSMFGLEL